MSSIFSRKIELIGGERLSMTYSTSAAVVISNHVQASLLPISIVFNMKVLKYLKFLSSMLKIMLFDEKSISNMF